MTDSELENRLNEIKNNQSDMFFYIFIIFIMLLTGAHC